jgi:uncharacterized sulfatase
MLEKSGELDNTIIVISGDHGIPGFPRAKTNVHDFGSQVPLAIRWPEKVAPNRIVKAPVSLIDIAPTFLAAAGLDSADSPDGQSLLPALAAGGSDSSLRGWVLIGRERHADRAREGQISYPVRALRTPDFLYVRNFKPDRWPAGDPWGVTGDSEPSLQELTENTYAAFPDIDSSPAKAWLVHHRKDPGMAGFVEFAWAKRASEELYDLSKDPHQTKNLANDPAYAEHLAGLRARLMAELEAKADPRLNDAFDRPPFHTTRDRK